MFLIRISLSSASANDTNSLTRLTALSSIAAFSAIITFMPNFAFVSSMLMATFPISSPAASTNPAG